jgi:NADH-quinone oxidoreductase subunit K
MYRHRHARKTHPAMMEPGLNHMLFIGAALFFIGIYGFLTRRNLITMLMSLELVLNSVCLNFIAFNKYVWTDKLDGLFFTVFIIAIAAAEAAVAIAIIIHLYRSPGSIDVSSAEDMKY